MTQNYIISKFMGLPDTFRFGTKVFVSEILAQRYCEMHFEDPSKIRPEYDHYKYNDWTELMNIVGMLEVMGFDVLIRKDYCVISNDEIFETTNGISKFGNVKTAVVNVIKQLKDA